MGGERGDLLQNIVYVYQHCRTVLIKHHQIIITNYHHNLMSLNNHIFHHIVRCFNSQYWSQYATQFTVCCVITRSFLKHTDLNVTEFLPKIILFPDDCTSSDLSRDPSDKIANY